MTHAAAKVSSNRWTHQALALALALLGGCASTPLPPEPAQPAEVVMVAPSAAAASPSATDSAAVAGTAAPTSAAGQPQDPLRPDVPVDLSDSSVHTDLWSRLRRGFAMPDLDTRLVRGREQYYASRPDYVQRMTERSSRYLFHIVEEVERRGMPTELALLPFIESAFNPQAMSVAKASGMWQFIPSTGKHYELAQNVFRDDRRDVLASTRAALDYLQKLHGMFGDWHLALAAYNWGEGSVGRAMARNRKAGRRTDYLSLKMPNETQLYVPKLQAVKNIIARPGDFGLTLPRVENHPYFLSVPIQRDIDVELVARLAGLESAEFHALNPSLNQPVVLAAGTPQVLLPYDNAERFVRALVDYRGPLSSWTAWVVPKTAKPADLARHLGMDEDHLCAVNRIPPRMLVKAGSTLLVARSERRDHDVPEHLAHNAAMLLVADGPAPRRTTVKARRSDSLTSVAARHGVSSAKLAQWNKLSSGAALYVGQSLVVFLPPRKSSGGRITKSPTAARKAVLKSRSVHAEAAPSARAKVSSPRH